MNILVRYNRNCVFLNSVKSLIRGRKIQSGEKFFSRFSLILLVFLDFISLLLARLSRKLGIAIYSRKLWPVTIKDFFGWKQAGFRQDAFTYTIPSASYNLYNLYHAYRLSTNVQSAHFVKGLGLCKLENVI